MGCAPRTGKRGTALIPTLALGLPAALDDVADFADAPGIGRGHALTVGAAIAIGVEAMRRLAKDLALLGRRHPRRLGIFARHRAIEARQATVSAHRDFAPGSRIAAI